MTTVIVKGDKMVCDGQVTFGDRIDATDFKKIRKINGCLVGGAGRLSSILAFFDWFEDYSNSTIVRANAPEVDVLVPAGLDDEDFTGIVMFTDRDVHIYEGGKRSYQVYSKDYYAIGSGSDFALAALDAGATAEDALEVAKKRDVSSGGTTFVEQLDEEDQILSSRDSAEGLTKEELLDMLFGKKEAEVVDEKISGEVNYTYHRPNEGCLIRIHPDSDVVTVTLGDTLEDTIVLSLDLGLLAEDWEIYDYTKTDWKVFLEYVDIDYPTRGSKRDLINLAYEYLDHLSIFNPEETPIEGEK